MMELAQPLMKAVCTVAALWAILWVLTRAFISPRVYHLYVVQHLGLRFFESFAARSDEEALAKMRKINRQAPGTYVLTRNDFTWVGRIADESVIDSKEYRLTLRMYRDGMTHLSVTTHRVLKAKDDHSAVELWLTDEGFWNPCVRRWVLSDGVGEDHRAIATGQGGFLSAIHLLTCPLQTPEVQHS